MREVEKLFSEDNCFLKLKNFILIRQYFHCAVCDIDQRVDEETFCRENLKYMAFQMICRNK